MMRHDTDFVNQYTDWLKQNIDQYKVSSNTYRITLPFLDRNNDHTEIYIIDKGSGEYLLTDDGYTINDLQLGNFEFVPGSKRSYILDSIVAAFGVTKNNNNELTMICNMAELPQKKHMLAQCIVKVNDMFFLSKKFTQSVFLEDVQHFLDVNDVHYVENVLFTGKSKLPTHYDFAIGRSQKAPERLIKVVNNMTVDAAKGIIFSWSDTKELRQPQAKLYTFIQDTDRKVSSDAMAALKEYDIQTAKWSEKDDYITDLIA